ncbi:invasion associated locus B family protein [Erythrobacter sp. W53]|uniref:invasion associated locus B family protein n=1 Tax=Erythrobacteraceae TaxID=335929 RepID=UPI0036D38FC0
MVSRAWRMNSCDSAILAVRRFAIFFALIGATLSTPLAAKESVGVFSDWAAFRDQQASHCYAIAMPAPSKLQRDHQPYATVATWPKRQVRGQVHFRLSRNMARSSAITASIGRERFRLTGSGASAWAVDRSMDAAIVAAMRSAKSIVIRAVDSRGRRFSNTYQLAGAASAMDAATIACAKLR